jgi:hypothetical protein
MIGDEAMARQTSALPELVWLPNHADNNDGPTGRLKNFQKDCKKGRTDSWTCKKTAKCGDVYLFWFGKPKTILAGVGVSTGDVEEATNDGWDWTDAEIGWFCEYDPVIALKEPLTIDDIKQDRLLAGWWQGRPFQGGPKKIVRQDIARRLVELILTKNPKDRRLARIIDRFLQ